MSSVVVGLFDTVETAHAAVHDLIVAGFEKKYISVVAADPTGKLYQQTVEQHETHLPGEGAATGVTSGAIIGGLLGLVIGAGLLFVPIGLVAAGPIAGLIAGSTVGAATGGVLGALIGMGMTESDAETYAEHLRQGATLVTVQTDDVSAGRAHDILDRDGAVNIDDRTSWYRDHGFENHDNDIPIYNADDERIERERHEAVMKELDTTRNVRIKILNAVREHEETAV